ncbi:ATP-grasp domain-containing protein [Absicoccus intestinalis]|uniref:ATP-grasp domain-containing protein n=2 Tax=Erysipelotrichaceae TaxID=128827 RepID=A0ABU4WKL1_9FIRM|nr:ATP-grasp domain-containing protein [Absicoccus sp. CLA-KB-P134]MDX8417106.1 ATP-grasp domain-containing protein [Absicoccus sp. CLA-KB-P134]
MKKMTILFPASYRNHRRIDEDMVEEYQAAIETGLFNTILFNYDRWLINEKLKTTDAIDISDCVLYRGWMLKPEQYQKLYKELDSRGIRLLTNPQAYEKMHLFPNVYPLIQDDTAKIIYFPDGKVDIERIKHHFQRFMVKDSVKSTKGTEFPSFFDSSITQAEFDDKMKIFNKYRGDLLTGGICIKEYLHLKHYGDVTNEFRVFYANGNIISVNQNSNQPGSTNALPMELAEKYRNLPSPFYTIDYAELENGTWKILEAGDGGVSGLPFGLDASTFFQSIYHAFMKG